MIKKTKRLTLRPLTLNDFQSWKDAYTYMREPQNEWDESNWDDAYLTKREFQRILKEQTMAAKMGHSYSYAVFRNDDNALVGHVNLNDISRGVFQNGYLGYRIFNPYWGFGYAKEAVKAALEVGFGALKLHRIEAGIQPKNKASIAVAKAAKLKLEGLSKKRIFFKDKWIDLQIYSATCEQFKINFKFPKER